MEHGKRPLVHTQRYRYTHTHTQQQHTLTHAPNCKYFFSAFAITVVSVSLRLSRNVADFPVRFYFGYVGNIW